MDSRYWVCPFCCTQYDWEKDEETIKTHNCLEKPKAKVFSRNPTAKRRIKAPPSEKQLAQRALVQALGTVTGLMGWVNSAVTQCDVACRKAKCVGLAIEVSFLRKTADSLAYQLARTEEQLRKELKSL